MGIRMFNSAGVKRVTTLPGLISFHEVGLAETLGVQWKLVSEGLRDNTMKER